MRHVDRVAERKVTSKESLFVKIDLLAIEVSEYEENEVEPRAMRRVGVDFVYQQRFLIFRTHKTRSRFTKNPWKKMWEH